MRLVALLVVVLGLAACASPGRAAARSACAAYGSSPTSSTQEGLFRATAQKDADLAASSDSAWTGLSRDIKDAYARADANAAAHNAGREVPAADLNGYVAADRRVRADCASAGRDLGPLKP